MRDPGVIDALDALERYARAFDEIRREQDAHYSARSFVRWLRLETAPGTPSPQVRCTSMDRGRA